MSFFDDSHVTDIGMQGSAGPSVGVWDMAQQLWEQQFRVDSQQALEEEIRNRWLENLQTFERKTGQRLEAPDWEMGTGSYLRYLDRLEGEEPGFLDQFNLEEKAGAQRLERADLAIRQLNDPELKSYQQIAQEVYAMQHATEERTASMSSRAGVAATVGGFAGAMAGSFSQRDPLNIITLPIGGAGRTVATRIATEMGVAGAVVAGTETAFVQPNRARAGLPERSLAFDVAAAMGGAGLIRGGIEGIGAGVRAVRGRSDIVLDFDDDQLRQMFENNLNSPRARAGDAALDDIQFVERNNPYGAGDAANARFLAELQDVQRVMGGAPQTAIARMLPPVPFETIERAADFQLVKERSPEVWARLEETQARLAKVENRLVNTKIVDDSGKPLRVYHGTIKDFDEFQIMPSENGDALGEGIYFTGDKSFAEDMVKEDAVIAVKNKRRREFLPGAKVKEVFLDLENPYYYKAGDPVGAELTTQVKAAGHDGIIFSTNDKYREIVVFDPSKIVPTDFRAKRRAVNREYQAAYKAVEAEAETLRRFQAAYKGQQQAEAVDVFGHATFGRPFTGAMLQHDYVQARVDAINAFNDSLDEKSLQLFQKQEAEPRAEGEEAAEPKPVYDKGDGTYDIGLKQPVDGEFRFATDDGDLSIAEAMRDLDDDVALEEAMRSCLL